LAGRHKSYGGDASITGTVRIAPLDSGVSKEEQTMKAATLSFLLSLHASQHVASLAAILSDTSGPIPLSR
jgi:L-cysteine desulfidase